MGKVKERDKGNDRCSRGERYSGPSGKKKPGKKPQFPGLPIGIGNCINQGSLIEFKTRPKRRCQGKKMVNENRAKTSERRKSPRALKKKHAISSKDAFTLPSAFD